MKYSERRISKYILRNLKRYKVMISKNNIILSKCKSKLSSTLHIAPDGEFIYSELIICKTLK